MLPGAGDVFWIELDPILGTEQAGRRPALVISERDYHEASIRAVVCPITSAVRSWPFNINLPPSCKTHGAVLIDQVRSIDRPHRMFGYIEAVPPEFLTLVQGRLAALLGLATVG